MLLSGSIECDNHNRTIGKCERSDKWLQRIFLRLYGLMFLSGRVECDDYNRTI